MKIILLFISFLCSFSFLAQTNFKKVSDSEFIVNDVISFGSLRCFSTNGFCATFDDSSNIKINECVTFLNKHQRVKVEIGFHTDARGSAESNMQFSHYRAKTIRQVLIERGVDSLQMTYCGYGENSPVSVYLSNGKYSLTKPNSQDFEIVLLTEKYINQFKQTNKVLFDLLHQFNRRVEIRITDIKPSN